MFKEIEIPGIHFLDQNNEQLSNSNSTVIGKSLMKQNMQTVNKHKFKSAQYSYICGDCPTNESQGEAQGGFYM
jgi:hypothetical protein